MRLSISRTLVRLLAVGHAVYSTVQAATVPSDVTLARDDDRKEPGSIHFVTHAAPAVRAPDVPDFTMSRKQGWGDTWIAFIEEPENSGWTRNTIRGMAQKGWEQAQAGGASTTMVAVFWKPGRGAWPASIPHDEGANQFPQVAPTMAPRLWGKIGGRVRVNPSDTNALWHAEDMAMFEFETYRIGEDDEGEAYGEDVFVAVYGQKRFDNPPQRQEPCSGDGAKIIPNCRLTLGRLDVDF